MVYVVFGRGLYTVADSEEAAQFALNSLPRSCRDEATYIPMPVYSLDELKERLTFPEGD